MKILLVLLSAFLPNSFSHHVLFVHTAGTKSHLIQMKPLMLELLERGHKVTSIIYSSVEITNQNYTEILIPPVSESLMKEVNKKLLEKGATHTLDPKRWWWSYNLFKDNMKKMTLDPLKTEKVKQLILERPKIDAVVIMGRPNAIFAEIFDCPIIMFSPAGPISFMMMGTTNVINPSIQPSLVVPFIEPMSFSNRIYNHINDIAIDIFISWQTNSMFEYQIEYLESELGVTVSNPSITTKNKMSIMLACSHEITHGAWQYLPNVIQVGGLQLHDAHPLSGALQDFMDEATEGAILVSFGSSINPDQMPEEKLVMFIETFKQLNVKVVWKWDKHIPDLPPNVMLSSWLPQQDLLAHPNLKVFVTHGGLGSVVEAIYHKAVIVGIPLSNDQKPNLLRATRHGYAVTLDWDQLNADQLVTNIKKAMNDKTMKENLERVHRIYMDREERPALKAAWWVEYVCRHQGANWLKSVGEEVSFVQYHHLDLLFLLLLVSLISILATFYFWRAVFRCCCARKQKRD